MTKISIAILLSLFASFAQAQQVDRVRLNSGSSESGEITKMSAVGITLKRGSSEREIPITEFRSIVFDDEPGELTQARVNATNTSYEQALDSLSGINLSDITNPYVQQEIEFYTAYCEAKLALLGTREIKEAGNKLAKFVQSNTQNFHYLEATELLGDLLVAAGNVKSAQSQYEVLARAPWPSYQKKAGVLVGNALLSQKKYAEAQSQFDTALAIADESEASKEQNLAAQLGKAVAVAALGNVEAGIKAVEQVIRDSDPENVALLASAYNSLGACHQQAGNPKEALFAYLHTDLLYRRATEKHAEALFHLASLWETVGQESEARQARAFLKEQYPGTRWARQLGS